MNCSTTMGDPNGTLLGSTDCLSENCAAAFLEVQNASVACYDCLGVYVSSVVFLVDQRDQLHLQHQPAPRVPGSARLR